MTQCSFKRWEESIILGIPEGEGTAFNRRYSGPLTTWNTHGVIIEDDV